MGEFIQKESISYTGSAKEEAITLDRDDTQAITEVSVLFSGTASDDAYFQVLRKDTATTANERDSSHDDSVGVLYGEQYLANGNSMKFDLKDAPRVSTTPRLYLSLGGSAGTVYVLIRYQY